MTPPIPRPRFKTSLLRHAALVGSIAAALGSQSLVVGTAQAMDTDIFTVPDVAGAAPNVLIVLDNTSNWSRANQKWPGGSTQGEAEVAAIKQVIAGLPGNVNVGLMEFVTGGNANNTGGFVRFAVSPVGTGQGATAASNRTAFSGILDTISANIGRPAEKRNSGTEYGNLFYDAYNYFAGTSPVDGASPIPSTRDLNGYMSSALTQFRSPLSTSTSCGNSYVIFITNPNASGPTQDTAANTSALNALGVAAGLASGAATTQLPLQNFTETTAATQTALGYSSACFASAPTGTPTDYTASCTDGTYSSCAYTANNTTTLPACATGLRYPVVATTTGTSTSSTTTGTPTLTTAPTTSCYGTSSSWTSADKGGLSCPATTTSTSGNTTTTTSYSCSYSVNSTAVSPNTCSATTTGPTAQTPTTLSALTNNCYKNNGNSGLWASSTRDPASLFNSSPSCPATTTSTSGTTTTTTTYACAFTGAAGASRGGGCDGGDSKWTITKTTTPSVSTSTTANKYTVTQTATPTITTTTAAAGGSTTTTLGNTFACYASLGSCSPTADYTCPAGASCACSSSGATTTGSCPAGARYEVAGNSTTNVTAPSTGSTTDANPFNVDEWARLLSQQGVPVGGTRQLVRTYAIDVYNAQPSAQHSSLLSNVAKAGGGKYFAAKNETAIKTALEAIFSEIQAVNSTFASASLPISATNRSQNQNQVYIGMFRPDDQARPRWFGNLKRYQLADFNGALDLADKNGAQAINLNTGFVTPCAASYWSTDSAYWFDSSINLSKTFITEASTAGTAWAVAGNNGKFTKSDCTSYGSASTSLYSDLPDGPSVEKGGAAQQQRALSPASRNVKTVSGGALVNLSTATLSASSNATVNSNIVNFMRGQDVTGELGGVPSTSARPSIHGDVVHSRPLPVTYGASSVVLYYGANDGHYRAVDGDTGNELWSFVSPDTASTLQRLMDNTPQIQTPSPTPSGSTAVAGTTPKEFFFDGSTGLYQTLDNTKVWIYPSMRRGGRMLYALDVSNPTAPTFLWKAGCPKQQGDDSGCADGAGGNAAALQGMGQTWSTPTVALLKVDAGTTKKPVVIVGGGYDTCEDADTASPSCGSAGSAKGARVFAFDAETGSLIKSFTTDRSVASDVSLVDINLDGTVDAAYVADTGGGLYRIDLSSPSGGFTPQEPADWSITKIAYTTGASRKFLFAPAVLPYRNNVYLAIVSGDREHPLSVSYPFTRPVTNRAYLYLDDLARSNVNLDGASASAMLDYSLSSTNACSSAKVLPGGANYGWYLDLTENGVGEQGVTSALIIGGLVSFSTNRPLLSTAATCANPLGQARGYWVNLLNGSGAISGTVNSTCGGSRSSVFAGGGLAPSPVAATVVVNGSPRTVVIGSVQRDGTTGSALSGQKSEPPINAKRKRTYWRATGDTR